MQIPHTINLGRLVIDILTNSSVMAHLMIIGVLVLGLKVLVAAPTAIIVLVFRIKHAILLGPIH